MNPIGFDLDARLSEVASDTCSRQGPHRSKARMLSTVVPARALPHGGVYLVDERLAQIGSPIYRYVERRYIGFVLLGERPAESSNKVKLLSVERR